MSQNFGSREFFDNPLERNKRITRGRGVSGFAVAQTDMSPVFIDDRRIYGEIRDWTEERLADLKRLVRIPMVRHTAAVLALFTVAGATEMRAPGPVLNSPMTIPISSDNRTTFTALMAETAHEGTPVVEESVRITSRDIPRGGSLVVDGLRVARREGGRVGFTLPDARRHIGEQE